MAQRDYDKEYREHGGTERQKKRRAARNKARRHMERAGRVSKGDGKEVDHKDYNPENNSASNLRVVKRKLTARNNPNEAKLKPWNNLIFTATRWSWTYARS